MDAYEATKIVLSRLQSLDPENAHKIMGLLLLQEHGEKEVIRLAFGPETLLHSVVLKARKELGLALPPSAPVTPSSASTGSGCKASPFLLRQNSASRLLASPFAVSSSVAWTPLTSAFSHPNSFNSGFSGSLDELQNSVDLISPSNFNASPSYGGSDLIDEFLLPDQPTFLGDPTTAHNSNHSFSVALKSGGGGGNDVFYPDIECQSPSDNCDEPLFQYGMGCGVNGYHHRRSSSAANLCLGDNMTGFGWEPCLYFARGYCKNGSACRFLHGLPEETATINTKMDAVVEQQFQDLLLRSKSQRIGGASQLMASAFPYSPTGSVRPSPLSSSSKCLSFLLQQQQNESQRTAAAALMLGVDETHKFMGRSRIDLLGNPGSRQIYLTFPAESTFREDDVSNYFSIYGPVQDVRIPYQQKRMFGFVTFLYPETVKLILAKGNPHFVCDSRVLVKPYKEKGKVPDKLRKQQQVDRGDFTGCTTPTLLDAREIYDLHQLAGSRMLYNSSSSQELLLRKNLEEEKQAAELQRAIELQGRRFMGLQLLDLKNRNLSSSSPSSVNSPAFTPTQSFNNDSSSSSSSSGWEESPTEDKSLGDVPGEKVNNSHVSLLHQKTFKEESVADANPNEDSDFQQRADHNLPDSLFASPTKSTSFVNSFPSTNEGTNTSSTANNDSISNKPTSSSLEVPSLTPCFFQVPRMASTGTLQAMKQWECKAETNSLTHNVEHLVKQKDTATI
ncbi:zinc finger CCCH domain-containing protein 53-like isoform X2 [Canna indica]|uniref:Zinc finger CCCH domain-containing protein 53-like isoform X2 n=1 Tax=Canna indica TaxID=4628 RepID=A0AAQ3QKI9_9LILI|nr:zinc finger CCCH domain-containing protein 53-like isoform X2 [Canna indica]